MGSLKEDHAYLYKRVRLKAIIHTLLGVTLVFLPSTSDTGGGALSTVQSAVTGTLTYLGIIYLLLGVLLSVGVFLSRRNYRFVRIALSGACIYDTLWLLILIALLIDRDFSRNIAFLTVFFGYLAYNVWLVRFDPGWKAIQIVKRIRQDEHDLAASK